MSSGTKSVFWLICGIGVIGGTVGIEGGAAALAIGCFHQHRFQHVKTAK